MIQVQVIYVGRVNRGWQGNGALNLALNSWNMGITLARHWWHQDLSCIDVCRLPIHNVYIIYIIYTCQIVNMCLYIHRYIYMFLQRIIFLLMFLDFSSSKTHPGSKSISHHFSSSCFCLSGLNANFTTAHQLWKNLMSTWLERLLPATMGGSALLKNRTNSGNKLPSCSPTPVRDAMSYSILNRWCPIKIK
jgi:hypothetical protein